MKQVFVFIACYVLAFLVGMAVAQADDSLGFRYGLGYSNERLSGQNKLFALNSQNKLIGVFHGQLEGGLWSDSRARPAYESAGFASYGLGIKPHYGPIFAQAFFGPGVITHTDGLLSTNVQFFHDLGIGFKGTDGTAVSVGYKHVSNAGMKLPNKGRDFFGIQLSIDL